MIHDKVTELWPSDVDRCMTWIAKYQLFKYLKLWSLILHAPRIHPQELKFLISSQSVKNWLRYSCLKIRLKDESKKGKIQCYVKSTNNVLQRQQCWHWWQPLLALQCLVDFFYQRISALLWNLKVFPIYSRLSHKAYPLKHTLCNEA